MKIRDLKVGKCYYCIYSKGDFCEIIKVLITKKEEYNKKITLDFYETWGFNEETGKYDLKDRSFPGRAYSMPQSYLNPKDENTFVCKISKAQEILKELIQSKIDEHKKIIIDLEKQRGEIV